LFDVHVRLTSRGDGSVQPLLPSFAPAIWRSIALEATLKHQ
jgi:hypothetical protein